MEGKKIRYRSAFEVLTRKEMQQQFGGYEGSGTYEDPYQLPEVVITPCSGHADNAIDPCKGANWGEDCEFCWEKVHYSGRCRNNLIYGNLYCSVMANG